jgi:D-xylose transport system substrate-binding protein
LVRGEDPPSGLVNDEVDNGMEQVPSVLLTPVAVTKDNIADTVVKDGFWTADQICTGRYANACAEAGIE